MRNVRSEIVVLPSGGISARIPVLLGMFFFPFFSTPSSAAAIRVPADYSTIQGAINAATHGDEIIVSMGTYTENINFLGKNIVLRSTDPTSTAVVAATIIDGNQAGSVVTFAGTEVSSCVLSGFTITRGRAPRGGGIYGNGSRATVQYNVISHNDATGGGITSNGGAAYDFDGILRSNQVVDNTAGRDGGALYFCDGLVENNLFARNSSISGGTMCWCGGTIRGNIFRDNHAGGGGGIYGNSSVIENNVIYNNTVTDHGGGLAHCYGTIRNNTIVGNQAGNRGGGLVLSPGTIINCIIWGNSAPVGAQLDACSTPSYSCIQGWSGGGQGNISDDPQLADPGNNDFHLLSSSPCIDAGGTVPLTVDFEGDPRPYDFTLLPRGDGSDFDIGADELSFPVIAFYPKSLANWVPQGSDATTQAVEVWYYGSGLMTYTIETTPSWLMAIPAGGSANGPTTWTHQIGYRTALLPAGDYAGTITITASGTVNTTATIPVRLIIGGSVSVVSPLGGELWYRGSVKQIEWQSQGPWDRVYVYLRRPGFYNLLATPANHEGLNSCALELPQDLPEASDYVIGVAWTLCPTGVFDESSSLTIRRLVETILWPTAGVVWPAGTEGTVRWVCANLPAPGQMDVAVWKAGRFARTLTLASCQNGTNSATVLLPADLLVGRDYQICLLWADATTVTFFSNHFTIMARILVPSHYPTIQAAINAATSGDEIIVSSGTYVENINFLGKNILLRSTDPTSAAVVAATVIDGNQAGSVVTFAGGETSSCVLAGFTIGNGRAGSGGGINGNNTVATIRNNTITGNTASGDWSGGGGISSCHGLIEGNLISGNLVSGQSGAAGGGLDNCNGTIARNVISNNTVHISGADDPGLSARGGGLASCGGRIVNNVVVGNVAYHEEPPPWEEPPFGAPVYSDSYGGGLYMCGLNAGFGLILNNTICGNSAGSIGGGLTWCGPIHNCIIYDNTAGESDPQLYGSATPTYSCIQDWSGGGTGNISADPRLTSGFHLRVDSPCIDAGGAASLTEDFEGDPRPCDFVSTPRGDGSDFDIGADEAFVRRIAFDPTSLINWAAEGSDATTQTVVIWYTLPGVMTYTIETTPSWLTAIPAGGSSDGPTSRTVHQIGYRTASLPEGDYAGTITILASGAIHSTATIPVCLIIGRAVTVVSPAGGEAWYRGSFKEIQWQSLGGWDRVYVYLRRPGYYALLSTTANRKGLNSCLVQLAQDLPEAGDYVIGVAWTSRPSEVYDESTSLTIRPLVERVVSPTTGTIWKVGTTATVVWTCRNLAGPSQMDLELWRGGTMAASLRRAPCQNGTNSATVSVPAALPHRTDYQLRLVWTEDTSVTFWGESFHVAGRVYVPGDYSSIQAAINAAPESEEIIVSNGTYVENINFLGKNIVVRSTNPTSPSVVGATIIDGRRAGSVVTFAGSELSSCILAGFTIRNGSARFGGGVCGNGTHAAIHHNLISSNSALGTSPNWGRGGGLYACNGTIESNRILANSSDYGGGLCDCQGTVQNNGIANNSARKDGGGLRGCTGTIWNNTIVSNTATASGGGLSNCPGTIRNCIVWSNTAATGPQLSSSSLPSYSCIQNWTGGGTGNLSADPLVAAPWRGDFHLLDSSPCIDAGGTVPLALDFEGDPRPYDLTAQARGDGSDFDIGADEAISPPTMFAITWPTSGTVWQAGTMGNLTFTRSYLPGPSQADVEVWQDGTSVTSVGRVACQDGPNTVPVRLAATVPAGTNYRIRMFWTLNRVFNSWSQGFTVTTASTLAVTLPTASTVWQTRTIKQVNWTSANFPEPVQLDLELWKSGQSLRLLKTLACPNGTNSTTVSVTADLAPGSDYQVFLLWTPDRGIRAASGRFTIVAAPPTTFTVGQGSGYDFQTIQAAIAAAALQGDGIIVFPGTYRENINFLGKNILVRSTDPTSTAVVARAVINGRSSDAVVTFSGREAAVCLLTGFTITGGRAASGGGIRGNQTSATIERNVISTNTATGDGGGIHECRGRIAFNTIAHNSSAGRGGGLLDCTGLISQNMITDNSAATYGGGLYGCHGTISRNAILRNRASGDGGGLGYCNGLIENNTIANNSATAYGGGLCNCGGTIRNNTIWANTAGNGGALYSCSGVIRNCILWQNSAPTNRQLGNCSPPSYCCIQSWTGGGTGNISSDPQLAAPWRGDFHLLATSPCIDAGGTVTLTQDFEGDPRPFDYMPLPRGDGSNFDIGADEAIPPVPLIAVSPAALNNSCQVGNDAPTQTLQVWDARIGTMAYTVTASPSWLTATPLSGVSGGPADRKTHQIGYRTASLPVGDHVGAITVTAPAANNNPIQIPVKVRIGSLVVVSPAGGERWAPGTLHDVVWQSQGSFTQVYLDLLRPGLSLRLATASNHPGVNRFAVRLPPDLTLAGDYAIRASSVLDPGIIHDESSTFAVVAPPTFEVIWPTTGTTWQAGIVGYFTFMCTSPPPPGEVGVELWKGGAYLTYWTGVPCQQSMNVVPLVLPAALAPGPNHQIRLRWMQNAAVHAFSGRFTVAPPPTFTITWPTTGTLWKAGTLGTVTWTCRNLPTPGQVYVEIWKGGKYVRYWTRAPVREGANSVSLRFAADLPSGPDYQIRLCWTENVAICSRSAPFSVMHPGQVTAATRSYLYY